MTNRYPATNPAVLPKTGYRVPSGGTPPHRPRGLPSRHIRPVRLSPWSPKEFIKPPNWPAPGFGRVVTPIVVGGVGSRIAGRVLSRFIPFLGWALLAYDLYDVWSYYSWGWANGAYGNYVKCNPPPDGTYGGHQFTFSGTPGGLFCTPQLPGTVFPNWSVGRPWLTEWGTRTSPTPRWDGIQAWLYPAPPPFPPVGPGFKVMPFPTFLPNLPPWLWPLSPPFTPMWPPIAPPVRWPRKTRRQPRHDRDLRPGPAGNPGTYYPPMELPGTQTGPSPLEGLSPYDQPKIWPHRPRKGTKERKVGLRSLAVARRIMGKILSGYSELGDLVDALYKGLPKEYQTKDANLYQKMQDMYVHADKMDMVKAITEMYHNDQHDRVWGEMFGQIGEFFDDYGIDLGLLRMPSA